MSIRPLGLALIIGASFLAGTMVPSAGTQSSATPKPSDAVKYVEVSYMKVDPAKTTEYLKVEQDLWKPLHQELVKKGQVKSWTLYGVQFPSGTDEKYDFVTVNAFTQFGQLENPYADFDQVLPKIHPDMKVEDFLSRTESSRRLVRSEIWAVIDHAE